MADPTPVRVPPCQWNRPVAKLNTTPSGPACSTPPLRMIAPPPDPVIVPSHVTVAPPPVTLTTAPVAATNLVPVLTPPPLRLMVPVSASTTAVAVLFSGIPDRLDAPVPAVFSNRPALLNALGSVRL